ncbi:hypothetical protein LSH36_26g03041 [Paralvinella palmiformis]|uniref:Uncharacterized protein n=1 Tax=Paralvinella palmiformis TaxID=53620 RepID=A0AAD9KA05_9ANNE|nr:hypothetical protein LSH36_26g03041 [Paralvinella palmiformis]
MADQGKGSIFLGLTRSETDVETKDTDTILKFKTAYGLFRCTTDCAEKLLSSLDEADDVELTHFISRKLSKGAFHTGSGSISAIDLRLGESQPDLYLCYCCLMQETKPDPVGTVTSDELASLGLDGISLEVTDTKSDLAQPESELLTDDVVTIAKPMLDAWYNSTTCYVSRCVQHLGSDVRYLIHAALTDANIDIQCSDESLKSDVKRFFQVCSLSGLLSSNRNYEQPITSSVHTPNEAGDLLVDIQIPVHQPTRVKSPVSLRIDSEQCNFENKGCTKYCEEWSTALENCDPDNHSQLRVVIENYKLKAIQDMNTLKRLLKQAETDHYALYRCYIFLKQCGNAPVLLQHAELEICEVNDSEMARVLQVLNEHLTQNGSLSR